jgi:hypothetical protein
MSYADSLLASGERILRRDRQHWFIFIGNARFGVLAVVAALLLLILRVVTGGSGTLMDLLGYLTLILFVGGLVMLGWSWLRYQNEEYVITSRRIIHADGVINKRASDSSLEKINDAVLNESIFGRIFGFGDLDIMTASEEGDERLRMLRDAKSFKKAMLEAKHDLEIEVTRPTMPALRSSDGPRRAPDDVPQPGGAPPAPPVQPAPVAAAAPTTPAAPPPAAVSPDEVTEALGRLGELRDKGVVTPEEFEAKKRELLGRL